MNKVKLGDLVEANVQTFSFEGKTFVNYLDTGNITENRIDNIQYLNIQKDVIPSRAKRSVLDNTILYSSVRPNLKHYGYIEKPLENMVVSTGFITLNIKDKNKCNPLYLYYNLSQQKNTDYLQTIAQTNVSSYPSITDDDLLNLEMKIADSPQEQQLISKVLSTIEDKIKLNNTINQELEKMAKTLYDYWFVQFDFPDENGRPYKSANGKMVYNEALKREIPAGWKVIKFDDLVEQAPKLNAIKAPDYKNQGNIPIVDQASTLITGRTDDMSYYYKNERNCVVFGDVTTYFKYINFPFAKGTDGTKIINAKDDRIPAILLYQLLKDAKLPNIGFARHYMFLREIKILLPPKDMCEKYYQATKGIMDLRAKNLDENYNLSVLRDFLLPLLMNGQVSVQK